MARYGLLRKLQVVHGTIAVSCTYLVPPSYYALFPLEKGIMLSSIYVFFSLASKKNMILLQTIRKSRLIVMVLAFTTIVLSFIPHLLSVAVTLAFILEVACCFPSKVKHRKSKTQKAHVKPTDIEQIEMLSHSLK